jgi:hypothetical protein
LVFDRKEFYLGGLTVVNSDNDLKGEGAAWRLLENRPGLAPGEQSESHVIRWQFDGQVPDLKNLAGTFVVRFKVFTEPSKAPQNKALK